MGKGGGGGVWEGVGLKRVGGKVGWGDYIRGVSEAQNT